MQRCTPIPAKQAPSLPRWSIGPTQGGELRSGTRSQQQKQERRTISSIANERAGDSKQQQQATGTAAVSKERSQRNRHQPQRKRTIRPTAATPTTAKRTRTNSHNHSHNLPHGIQLSLPFSSIRKSSRTARKGVAARFRRQSTSLTGTPRMPAILRGCANVLGFLLPLLLFFFSALAPILG